MFTQFCEFIINKYIKPHPSNKYLNELKNNISSIKCNDIYYGETMCPTIINYDGKWYTSYLSFVPDYRTSYIIRNGWINYNF